MEGQKYICEGRNPAQKFPLKRRSPKTSTGGNTQHFEDCRYYKGDYDNHEPAGLDESIELLQVDVTYSLTPHINSLITVDL